SVLAWLVGPAAFAASSNHSDLPKIVAFNRTGSSPIVQGESVALNWCVTSDAVVSISPDIGAVAGNEVVVTPSRTTTYTLVAKNAAGVSKPRKVTVTVAKPATETQLPNALLGSGHPTAFVQRYHR